MTARMVHLFGAKHGVGTTTLAVLAGQHWINRGKRALYISADTIDARSFLAMPQDFQDELDTDDLPSDGDLQLVVRTVELDDWNQTWCEELEAARQMFDLIVVDWGTLYPYSDVVLEFHGPTIGCVDNTIAALYRAMEAPRSGVQAWVCRLNHGRALRNRDVCSALGISDLVEFAEDVRVSRKADAGFLSTSVRQFLPDPILQALFPDE